MKKNEEVHPSPGGWRVKKWLLFMQNLLVILLMTTFSLYANQTSLAQKVSIQVSNANLKVVIGMIEKQTRLGFMYNEMEVVSVKNLTLSVKEMEVSEVLDILLKGSPLVYSIDKKTILITKKTAVATDTVKAPVKWTIKGKVTDSKKIPLPGASVYVKGTTLGVSTNDKGEYAITLTEQKNLYLFYSFIGMKTKEVLIKGSKTIDILLEDEASDLDEVRVVAYGKSTKRQITGAVSSIKGEDILSVPSSNIASLLQGRVAGMDIANISGSPGSAGTATIVRGFNSLNSEQRNLSSPLWVIDGVPVSNMTSAVTGTSVLAEIDPEMIESIEVLKDAAAASLYGSRAANGVILVTTKKGKEGQRIIKAGISYTYSYLPKFPTVFAGVEARRYKLQALENECSAYLNSDLQQPVYPVSYEDAYRMAQLYSGGKPSFGYWWGDGTEGGANGPIRELQDSLNPFHNNSTNWFKRFFNVGKILNANVQALYGAKNYNVSTGVAIYDEKGIVRNTGFQRFTFMTNVGFTPTEYFSIAANFAVSYAKRKRNSDEMSGVKGSGANLPQISSKPFNTSTFLPDGGVVEQKLLESIDGIKEKNDDIRLRTSLSLGINFTSWLRFVSTNSVEYALSKSNRFSPSYLSTNKWSKSEGNFVENRMILTENMLTFSREFKEMHKVDILVGASVQYDQMNSMGGLGQNGPSDYVHYVTGGWPSTYTVPWGTMAMKGYGSNFTESALISYLGRVNYSYMQKYLLEATIRRDGSSKFGKAKPWGTFPSVSCGWVFSDEGFMDFFEALNFGKLRLSWGQTGTQFSEPYLAYGLFTKGDPFLGNPSVLPSSLAGIANPNLSWETTTQYNVGLDLDLWNYRLGINIDYYSRLTEGVLMPIRLAGDYSMITNRFENAGSIYNGGVEVAVKYDIIRRDDFRWKLTVNFARNWNRFESSYNGRDLDNYILGKPLNGIKLLKSLGIIQNEEQLVYKYIQNGNKVFLSPQNNVPQFYTLGDMRYLDANGGGEISAKDGVYIGSPLPKAVGGIMSEIKWKNFDFNLLFNYSLGRTIVNASKGIALTVDGQSLGGPILTDIRKYTFWTKPGDDVDFPRLAYEEGKNNFGTASDLFVEKVNFLRLKNFIVGYTLPEGITKKIGLSKVRCYVSGENIFTWTNYTGLDPESVDIMTGYDNSRSYPLNRKLTLGLSVNF
ncbi:SusC/RagA family TonB-linked outer membrane protein [Sanguibacteroides justesenii]|uniref:SusC/RagA family TonB-linked outer membrane protein n=1 Tax=Sanguibacteroides justesenii TaxID=1547597 RepID=UPI000D842A88|nr:SusC/RagA family TonB-linked outer membrane protein [Sanguibacteroides justesenii]PXZ43041.1 SusC/RagA family TonB-linked outer membrane protein [Sanguibacteroides justesenii]